MNKNAKQLIIVASVFLFLGVLLGAMGAHALKSRVAPELLLTFETGIRYHFYHALALLFLGLLQQLQPHLSLKSVALFFIAGILLFSFNCYFYTITHQKLFAMIVPLGGFSFLFGWLALILKLRRVT